MKQLDFLAVLDRPALPAPAAIVILPAVRMKGELRAAAATVLELPADRQRAQKERCVAVYLRLFRNRQIPKAEIERAATEFRAALECEMRRQLIWQIIWAGRGGTGR